MERRERILMAQREDLQKEASEWWSSLSINEQKRYTSQHPFYGAFDSIYVVKVVHGITDLHLWLKENQLLDEQKN